MTAPAKIIALADNEIFVFGSNVRGRHVAGAARFALETFGAVWGEGEGLQGQSYAIPTMEGLPSLAEAVERFLIFAAEYPELIFLVTAIGTGIAGHDVASIAPLFRSRTNNVHIPIEFEERLA